MKKETITVNGINFIVSAKLVEEGAASPWSKKGELVNHFKVTVKVGNKSTSFDFWGSINDYNNGVTELEDLKNALYCFVNDACSADQSFENFCREFGYDEDSRTAERTYKACCKSLDKYNKLTSANIYDTVNALNE